ncbi:hypothetical protein E2C01_023841 [Portunus trituberculatus]|uniref:Uncharacterized protein n=1 Tax=Portunus trituberculatus TaxID=210409 RepID=A0A5B7ECR1_PORTR|nr:hypothetical protein [Portunus trituberculatus]
MVPEDVALTDVHVTHHQLAEVFCLVVLMVLVRMTMAWGMVVCDEVVRGKRDACLTCFHPTSDRRNKVHK